MAAAFGGDAWDAQEQDWNQMQYAKHYPGTIDAPYVSGMVTSSLQTGTVNATMLVADAGTYQTTLFESRLQAMGNR